MALAFVQKQVQEKRRKLEELDKNVVRERFDLNCKKKQVLGI